MDYVLFLSVICTRCTLQKNYFFPDAIYNDNLLERVWDITDLHDAHINIVATELGHNVTRQEPGITSHHPS